MATDNDASDAMHNKHIQDVNPWHNNALDPFPKSSAAINAQVHAQQTIKKDTPAVSDASTKPILAHSGSKATSYERLREASLESLALPALQRHELPERKATISRSTYFRAKRNLRAPNTHVKRVSSKAMGRPQKLNSDAEKVIREQLEINPATELKVLRCIVQEMCGINISLSSISRRLKALGCSPSQLNQARRQSKHDRTSRQPCSELVLGDPLHHDAHHNAALQEELDVMENYQDLSADFSPDLDTELQSYDSPGIDLGMLQDMHDLTAAYPELAAHGKLDVANDHQTAHLYDYDTFQHDKDLYQQDFTASLYRHTQPHMLYDADINTAIL